MNTFGRMFRISIFGESHGPCVGCTIDGLPAGFEPDFDEVMVELRLRSPRKSTESTARNEKDEFEIMSGLYNSRCTGMPITVMFKNSDARSIDYKTNIARPSHADYAVYKKYGGFNDGRGGGAFSGRLTTPIVFAGALAKQLLKKHSIAIISHVLRIGMVSDEPFDPLMEHIPELDRSFPLLDREKKPKFLKQFEDARLHGTSLGGTVECAITGISNERLLPFGIGEPFFDSIESVISHIMFSIPAIHGIEFGAGFSFASSDGASMNDEILPNGRTLSNNSGGINGGISNGMPIIFRTCFRPVPTIRRPQRALDIENCKQIELIGNNRHDICILPRGCVIVEAAAAIALYDLLKCSQAFERK